MILLVGGTSETAPLAEGLAEEGFAVLVSTATDVTLDTGDHPGIRVRTGPLNQSALEDLVRDQGIRAIVDASHPYASEIQHNAQGAAEKVGIPYFRWLRPGSLNDRSYIHVAEDHAKAAELAFSFGRPVLLTTGSRNLSPYVEESARTGVPLTARVLPHADSTEACRRAGLSKEQIIIGRGPFSLEENRAVIRAHGIGVIVTKDSGEAGGVPVKIEAAVQEACEVVVVRRPEGSVTEGFSDVLCLVDAVLKSLRSQA
jgi:precorrin-6A/cobalt-precorrin-6A reductase